MDFGIIISEDEREANNFGYFGCRDGNIAGGDDGNGLGACASGTPSNWNILKNAS